MYYCAECKAEVTVTPEGEVTRTCEHDCAIIAPRSAVLYGEGEAA